jgi:hypothetical protein
LPPGTSLSSLSMSRSRDFEPIDSRNFSILQYYPREE